MVHQFLHRLCDQNQHVARLIVIFGPSQRVQFFLSRRTDIVIVSTLGDSLGLQDILGGELDSVEVPALEDVPH